MDPEKVTIEYFHSKNFSPSEIIKRLEGLDVCDRKVQRVCKRLDEGRLADNRHLSGRRRSVRTPAMIKRVRERIRRNPQRSMNLMAKQLGTVPSCFVMCRRHIICYDISYYQRGLGTEEAKQKKQTKRLDSESNG
jgi:hypothetical protein